ncbi:MAG TPA: hypothetical protein VHZ50_02770 [Puia sp.]|nr:hypothetical protein [Puia sp.]
MAGKKIACKAKEYGYSDKRADDIGMARAKYKKGQEPVAKDTNKTRRSMRTPMRGR